MTGREKKAAGIAAVLTVGITGYSAWKLLVTGVLSWHIRQPEFVSMMSEMLVVWLLLSLSFLLGVRIQNRKLSVFAAAVIVIAFCWLHKLLLPVLFTGAYTVYLILTGMWFCRVFLRKPFDPAWHFLTGSAVTIMLFCLFSLLKLGSITKLRAWVIVSGCLLMIWYLRIMWMEKKKRKVEEHQGKDDGQIGFGAASEEKTGSVVPVVMFAAIITLVLLQAGRMNMAVDFDSIWYGVRSDVMLNSGNGIYEDLGTLGVVYTYSKGFETLLLPLAGLPSYSFTIAMNLWTAVLLLYAAYRTARVCLEPGQALWVPFLMAALPGIMNMADTAKADLMTVLCQTLMVQSVIWCVSVSDSDNVSDSDDGRNSTVAVTKRSRSADWLVAGMAAGGVSLALKPTAVVYSPAIVGMSMLWLIHDYICNKKNRNTERDKNQHEPWMKFQNCRIWLMLIPSALALAGIWGRTLKLVGVPVTSVFYGIFQKLGFQVKYPFYASGFPSAGSGRALPEQVLFLFKRLYGVLINPQGDDMAHVVIAWGTVLPVILLILWFLFGIIVKTADKKSDKICSYFMWLLVPIGIVNLISLYSLSQIDGNYYMLYYVLMILAAVIWLGNRGEAIQNVGRRILIPVWIYAVLLCGLTNWAWALGNGGIDLVNRGYYPHLQMERQKRSAQGSKAIWDILAADSRNRVIALGEHPGVLTFPCWVQSYVDVSGYWGNPDVVASPFSFLNYLHFAEVDYIYMEKEYVDTTVRIYQIIRSLVEAGWLYDVRDENGNLILTVREPSADDPISLVSPGEKMQNLQVFDERYIQHP